MTLADVSRMYGVDSAALRRILGIGPGIPMDREIRDLGRPGTAGVPAPDEVQRALILPNCTSGEISGGRPSRFAMARAGMPVCFSMSRRLV